MAYHVGSLVFEDWQSLHYEDGWTDTFIITVSAQSGLPPADYARVIKRILPPLVRLRRGASVWVRVDAPGRWYLNELQLSLRGTQAAIAVTQGDTTPEITAFSFIPRQRPTPMTPPPIVSRKELSLPLNQMRCLQVLARIQGGTVVEVASLAGLSEKTARNALRSLTGQDLLEFMTTPPRKRQDKRVKILKKNRLLWRMALGLHRWRIRRGKRLIWLPDKHILTTLLAHLRERRKRLFRTQPKRWWRVRRKGKSLALRWWGIPPGVSFLASRERDYQAGWRHVRTSRLALDWVRRSGLAEIWAGWSEVSIRVDGVRAVPDALLWGEIQGKETLFWVEVQGGSKPKRLKLFRERMCQRLERAISYAELHGLRLVFIVLGKPWAIYLLRETLKPKKTSQAILLQTWLDVGELPRLIWGAVQSGGL